MDINEIIRQVTEEICSKYGAQTQTPAAGDGYTPADMAKYIDHTYLKPEASVNEIRKICDEAKKYHCASVCVNPSYIQYVAQQLEGSGVTKETLADLLSVDPELWKAECKGIHEFYAKFGDKLPQRLADELSALEARLG